ncbi:hypothetical protein [Streptomyces sp. NPDC002537]
MRGSCSRLPVEELGAPVGIRIRRSDLAPEERTAGVTTQAARPDLLTTLGAEVDKGVWLSTASERLPVTVLGAVAALNTTREGAPRESGPSRGTPETKTRVRTRSGPTSGR